MHARRDETADLPTPMACPVTRRQLEAFEMVSGGLKGPQAADMLGISKVAMRNRLIRGRRKLGVRTTQDALSILVDGGWITRRADMPPAASSYLAAFDEYLRASPHDRDQLLVRDLCNDALDEMLSDANDAGNAREAT